MRRGRDVLARRNVVRDVVFWVETRSSFCWGYKIGGMEAMRVIWARLFIINSRNHVLKSLPFHFLCVR